MAGADGGEAGTSLGTAGVVTLIASAELSVVLSWATLFSTGASGSGVLCNVYIFLLKDSIGEVGRPQQVQIPTCYEDKRRKGRFCRATWETNSKDYFPIDK